MGPGLAQSGASAASISHSRLPRVGGTSLRGSPAAYDARVRIRFPGAALVLVLTATLAGGCSDDESATVLTVLADVSLTEAFEEIGKVFEEANPGVEVRFAFAGANELASRLAEGETADVVAMAGQDTFQRLIDSGLAQSATDITSNTLAVTTGEGVEGVDSLEDLANDGVRVAMAAAESPEGQLARKMLGLAAAEYGDGWEAAVLANVIAGDITMPTLASFTARTSPPSQKRPRSGSCRSRHGWRSGSSIRLRSRSRHLS